MVSVPTKPFQGLARADLGEVTQASEQDKRSGVT